MKSGPTLCSLLALTALFACREEPPPVDPASTGTTATKLTIAVEALEEEAFGAELEARRFENEGVVPFWDRLLEATPAQRLEVLAALSFDSLTLGIASPPESSDLGIITRQIRAGGEMIDPAKWKSLLTQYKKAGYSITHSDWHHSAFHRDTHGAAISEVRFTLQGSRAKGEILDRLEFKGSARVVWDESGPDLRAKSITLLSGQSVQRRGPLAFKIRAVIEGNSSTPTERDDMGAINVYDLNGDQLPEIILGNANKILWNKGNFQFEPGPIIPEGGVFFNSVVGLVADLNGDSIPDWLSDTAKGDLALWLGKLGGGFEPRPRRIRLGAYQLRSPSVLTAGDIDQDGDLDLFVGQWRSLYEKMPNNFWDANDGYGNTLLLNDGHGKFTDATEAAGLLPKRFRRSYSASFLDLDADQDLDLLVVSDFHGVDIWLNDGSGKFTEATGTMIDNPYSFGMSHTVADYNRDGQLDFYVLGMGSTTARRLERMKANPKQFPEANKMRSVMGYGNRMYLAQSPGLYAQPPYHQEIARTGWAWGSSSFDFDNDGDQDIYAANGHISGSTTRDYCTNFWCRDIYLMQDFPKREIASYLESLPQMEEQSWDGYQVNPLLVNQAGNGFRDLAFALDLGLDVDCRRIISADLDLDGRVDLLVDRMEGTSGFFHDGKTKVDPAALLILQNVLPEAAQRNWIGFTLEGGAGVSPLGATITIQSDSGTQRAVILSGDSFMCQHPAQSHFGLGSDPQVHQAIIIWPNGKSTILKSPTLGTYHRVLAPTN